MQEEEKKENNNESEENSTSENKVTDVTLNVNQDNRDKTSSDLSKSPVRTRSQNKMEPAKGDKPKPVKKTVTFGTVESCEDIFLPLKKIPKHHAPLVPIIKKKSSLKPTEYSSILKPAKLTDLSSKSSLEHHEGYLRKNLNPLSKPMNKFSQISETRCVSPPPRNTSPLEKDTSTSSAKFVLPVRSAHSSRVIKPNKRFIDGEEPTTITSTMSSGKVLKKPKLKRLVFNNLPDDDDKTENHPEKSSEGDKSALKPSSLFKDKTTKTFTTLSTTSRKPILDIFSYEKEPEYSQDENSNLDGLEKHKPTESTNKEERSGHAMRKLMDISDASSSSSTSSGSESEESFDSESVEGSGDEEDSQGPLSPEKEKSSASQLLRGKVIIREARLQLNSPIQSTTGLDGPFSTLSSLSCKLNMNHLEILITCTMPIIFLINNIFQPITLQLR